MHPCPKCGHQPQDEGSDVDQAELGPEDDMMDEALADLEAQLDESAAGKLPKKGAADVTIAISTGKKKEPPFASEEDEDEEV